MNYLGSKTIETKRLILRKSESQEQKGLWEILCIPEVNKYYLTCKFGFDWEQQRPFFENKVISASKPDVFQWSILKKEDGKCIGQLSVQSENIDASIRGIGWFIDPEEQGNGYATEAAEAVLDYMFNEVQIQEIRTEAAVENVASWRLMEKLGFIRRSELTHKIKYTYVDMPVDAYSYGLTNEEYQIFISNKNDIKKR